MSVERGMRVAVAGATGALGSEVLAVLAERRFPVRELVPLATARSTGQEIEFAGELYPVQTEAPDPRAVDLFFLCAPAGACLDLAARAARGSATTIDVSGGLAGSGAVPLLVAGVHAPRDALEQPLLAAPAGPALAWVRALAPLERAFGLRRVVGMTLEAAAAGGRGGIEALSAETVALFNQKEPPAPSVFPHPVAFDCIPRIGEPDDEGATARETELARTLQRLLGEKIAVAVTAVRVPTFCGDGAALAVETESPAEPSAALAALQDADGVEVCDEPAGPTTRATAGREAVLVGRVRRDPSHANGLLLWIAADGLRLAASNAVRLAEARFRAH